MIVQNNPVLADTLDTHVVLFADKTSNCVSFVGAGSEALAGGLFDMCAVA
jgi:hypothetical protein